MTPLLLAQAVAAPSTAAETVVFVTFAVIGIGAGVAMITMKNIVHSALMLVVNFVAIAALYLALQSEFLAIVQIIVYAGAIMVLFLFVIMLLGVDRDDLLFDTKRWHVVGATVAGVALAGVLLLAFAGGFGAGARCGGQADEGGAGAFTCAGLEEAYADGEEGSVGFLADRLFRRYTFPFEAAAVLLTVATIGALVLGRRHDLRRDDVPVAVPTDPGGLAALPSDADRLFGGDGDHDAGRGGH